MMPTTTFVLLKLNISQMWKHLRSYCGQWGSFFLKKRKRHQIRYKFSRYIIDQ